jgi:hypothetical protein
MQVIKQWIFMLTISALALLRIAAFGQSAPINTADIPIANQVAVNQCSAGEPVLLNGTLHVEYSISTDTNGNNFFTVTAANNLSGVGQTSAAQYAASDSQDYTLSSTQASAEGTFELKADLVPQGDAGTAMTIVQRLQLTVDNTGNLAVQVVSSTTTCGS